MIPTKFKIYDLKNKKYVIENTEFSKNKIMELFIGTVDLQNNSFVIPQKNDFLLLQCLNFNDKNSKEIYEGHILKCKWLKDNKIEYGIALYDLDNMDGLPSVNVYRDHTFNLGIYLRSKEVEVEIIGDALIDDNLMECLEKLGNIKYEIGDKKIKGLSLTKLENEKKEIENEIELEIKKIKNKSENIITDTRANLYHSLSESRGDLLFIIETQLSEITKTDDLEQIKKITNNIKNEMEKFSNHHRTILEKIRKIK